MRADPKVVQEVSAATDNLLESLGALAVEVTKPYTHIHSRSLIPTHVKTGTNMSTEVFVSKVQSSSVVMFVNKINSYQESALCLGTHITICVCNVNWGTRVQGHVDKMNT